MSRQHLTWEAVCRRAGGRRHYNSMRQLHAFERRRALVRFWGDSGGRPGWQAAAARLLGVHRSTITRDVQTLLDELNRERRCPLCGHGYRPCHH